MAGPTPYVVSYSFGGFQANNPSTPLPGPALDNELADIAAAVATLVSAIQDVRRSDGALKNGIVTFDSFEQGLQLLIDPTNGQLVAAAVAGAQASATAASGSAATSTAQAVIATAQAVAAAASAATVNLSLYLAKANNLAGLGSLATSRANLGLGSSATFDAGPLASNIVQLNGAAKIPAYDGSLLTNIDTVPIGATIWINDTVAPTGFLKENGSLLTRASFPRLAAFALASGNIVSDGTWLGGSFGAFSTGDLATTFRVPDARGEFIRGYDDGRGVDSGRAMGTHQAADNAPHTHAMSGATWGGTANGATTGGSQSTPINASTIVLASQGVEGRPRNNVKLACIKAY